MQCDPLRCETVKTPGSQGRNLTGGAILSDAVDAVLENAEQYNVLSLLQSTGYGKSKAFVDLLSLRRTVLVPCAISSTGVGVIPEIISEMTSLLKTCESHLRNKVAGKIIYALCAAAQRYPSTKELHEAQLVTFEFYEELRNIWSTLKPKGGTPVVVRFATNQHKNQSYGEEKDCVDDSVDWELIEQRSSLVIAFDEIASLASSELAVDDYLTPVRCLSRFLNLRVVNKHLPSVVLLFSATSSRATTVYPGHEGSSSTVPMDSDNKLLDTGGDATLSSSPGLKPALEIKKDPPALTSVCLRDQFQKEHILLSGRPGWKAHLALANNDYRQLMQRVYDLLGVKRDRPVPETLACALFCIRFQYRPIQAHADQFVTYHLATYQRATRRKHDKRLLDLCAIYLPELILVEASARLTSHEPEYSLAKLLPMVGSCLVSPGVMIEASYGDRGEIAISAGILYSLDAIRHRKIGQGPDRREYNPQHKQQSMYSDITVEEFLQSLGFRDVPLKHFEDHVINCNHLQRFPCFSKQIMAWAFDNHCAILLPPQAQGADIAIVTKSSRGIYGLILIQSKNYSVRLSEKVVQGYLDGCLASYLLKDGRKNHNNRNVISIVAAAGNSGLHTICQWISHPRRNPDRKVKAKDEAASVQDEAASVQDEGSSAKDIASSVKGKAAASVKEKAASVKDKASSGQVDLLQLSIEWKSFVELSIDVRAALCELAGKSSTFNPDIPSDVQLFTRFGPSAGLLVLETLEHATVNWNSIIHPNTGD